ncbi:MAG TPA: aminotransferase class V-fold PLP-dependent enzyme [Vicinamibacterales bacterium]|nr:aminotransferase class V-fold PLP-dependent enzyme [Vicinamibacterales bacterium]
MPSRRAFLTQVTRTGIAATAGVLSFADDSLARIARASAQVAGRAAADVAADEDYWREVQQAFTLDRTIVNLNNGGVCPSPRVVHEAFKRYLDISNQAPVYHMWQVLDPNIETVRRMLAADFGCDREEMAITRNASEALMIVQLGLDLRPGDEVVTTNQDYPRMLDTWEQRVRRDGIVVKKVSLPTPARSMADLVRPIEAAITSRTKLLHVCHVVNLTGQIMPIRDLTRLARERGIRTIVDGAHAFQHFPFKVQDLDCDYYGCSLHKWALAPIGTGFLYVRRELIPGVWPLTPCNVSLAADIRKFEEIGTHPAANHNAIAEALTFQHGIGLERKAARLRYLRDRWARRLETQPGIRLNTNLALEHSCGLANVGIEGIDPGRLVGHLWTNDRIIVTPIKHAEFEGVRVTPNVYTTLEEVDTFVAAMERVLKSGGLG